MPQETYLEKQEENISIHIFSVSAGMVGVCLTVIGIINMITTFKRSETWAYRPLATIWTCISA